MEHLFLPKELSNKLIEMGFNEPCIGIYVDRGIMTSGGVSAFKHEHTYYKENGAILFQQAIDWFRVKHNFHIEVLSNNDIGSTHFWSIKRWSMITIKSENYKSYYEALIKGIKEAITLLK